MLNGQSSLESPTHSALLLAIDTCGPIGSVALGRMEAGSVTLLGQIELDGRNCSSTLVAAVGELLAQSGVPLNQLHAMVAVNGPGSFTGIRVGLAAGKGLAEAAGTPVAAISRLEVLAAKAGTPTAALDAHRHEVFIRTSADNELLAGIEELATIHPAPQRVAFCDEAAEALLAKVWPSAERVRVAPPTASDALVACLGRIQAREFVDLAELDGHYLRRSDAEIFGAEIQTAPAEPRQP